MTLRGWDGRLLLAVALVLLALGLPWSPSTLAYTGGWMVPSYCVVQSDLTMSCTGAFISPGFLTGRGQLSGADTVARVFLVGALLLIALAPRTRWATCLLGAAAALTAGLLLHGLGMMGGQVATIAAIVLLVSLARRGESTRTGEDRREETEPRGELLQR